MHLSSAMTLRITTGSDGQETTLKLSGRIRSTDIESIREAMKGKAKRIVFDLEEVTLVDLDVVRFLGVAEAEGVELVNHSPYIRDWIFKERDQMGISCRRSSPSRVDGKDKLKGENE
jgi:hypothetical protein